MKAILSDIHGNLTALEAVLKDIESQGIKEIYCLGDVIGYGPNPCECVDLIMNSKVVLLGNHDQGALFDPDGFNPSAEMAIFWTRKQIEESPDPEARSKRWDFLSSRPRFHREGEYLFVHGSARNPLNEYVFPEDIYNHRKMERIFSMVEKYCFQGHTHVPGIFVEQEPGENFHFSSPEDLNHKYTLDQRKTLCNVGSVGQPRDNNPNSCYVILDNQTIHYRRIAYNIEATAKKIYSIPELQNFLGERLFEGR
ncbi:MAG: metallophosphoesterase family protein [Planctomycetia bacterium]